MVVKKYKWSAVDQKYMAPQTIEVPDDFVLTPGKGSFLPKLVDKQANGYVGDYRYEFNGQVKYSHSPHMFD